MTALTVSQFLPILTLYKRMTSYAQLRIKVFRLLTIVCSRAYSKNFGQFKTNHKRVHYALSHNCCY